MASRQPYRMPLDGGGDPETFPALPFAGSPRKQSLFICWLFFLLAAAAVAYVLSPFWVVVLSSLLVQKRNSLQWILILLMSAALMNISAPFLQFVFVLAAILRASVKWTRWILFELLSKPVTTTNAAYLQISHITHYFAHQLFGIQSSDHPFHRRLEQCVALASSTMSAAGGYHLINSRVARNYTVILKSGFEGLVQIFDLCASLRHTSFLPTSYFQSWAWWATAHILEFALGGLSWQWTSWSKLFVLLGPTLLVCLYQIYQYIQVIVPPRSKLDIAVDSIRQTQQMLFQRQAVEQAEWNRLLLENMNNGFTSLSASLAKA
ncbi:hypothetical protein GGX14DRAFT_425346 [Mycena pura]|uniref:Uncharacterized protein n=1 Tax=Mycena pura TaxID=153505 RepID=A0AAD6YNI8_9AGAR|nr:hypothetical protein GGX14DRAFT_425346 [Mycena pura]